MLTSFLIGLAIAVATAAIIYISCLCGKWLKEYIAKRLKQKEKHKVVFTDTRTVMDKSRKEVEEMVKNAHEISFDDLERMCDETPFVSAYVDEDGNITDYEKIKAEEIDENFYNRLKLQHDGIMIFER